MEDDEQDDEKPSTVDWQHLHTVDDFGQAICDLVETAGRVLDAREMGGLLIDLANEFMSAASQWYWEFYRGGQAPGRREDA